MTEEKTIYEQVGGTETFRKMVDIFYAKIEADFELRAMFPEDLEPGKKWQYLFLQQYFGGPHDYIEERGHPRLRMRHSPFPIDDRAQKAWLQYMLEAVDEVGIQEPARGIMRDYFIRGSEFMINRYKLNDE